MRLLYVYGRRSRFTDIDRDILARHFELTELGGRSLRAAPAAARTDVVVVWFAGWHALLPAPSPGCCASRRRDHRRLRRRQRARGELRHAARRASPASRAAGSLRRATRLMANSARGRARGGRRRAEGDDRRRPPRRARPGAGRRPRRAARGRADRRRDRPRRTSSARGCARSPGAAALLPDVPFTLAGRVDDEAAAAAGPGGRAGGPRRRRRARAPVRERGRLRPGVPPRGLRHGRRRGDGGRLRPRGHRRRARCRRWSGTPASSWPTRPPRPWPRASGRRSRSGPSRVGRRARGYSSSSRSSGASTACSRPYAPPQAGADLSRCHTRCASLPSVCSHSPRAGAARTTPSARSPGARPVAAGRRRPAAEDAPARRPAAGRRRRGHAAGEPPQARRRPDRRRRGPGADRPGLRGRAASRAA